MMVTLTEADLGKLSPVAFNEIVALMGGVSAPPLPAPPPPDLGGDYLGIDLEDVADLTLKQVQTWMERASDKTKLGLRVIAEHGPVIRAQLLTDAGIENLAHFQSRTTIRTRTVTGDAEAYLLSWNDWSQVEDGEEKYAVTPITHQSLRRYFGLP
jgi:hypothetical protein